MEHILLPNPVVNVTRNRFKHSPSLPLLILKLTPVHSNPLIDLHPSAPDHFSFVKVAFILVRNSPINAVSPNLPIIKLTLIPVAILQFQYSMPLWLPSHDLPLVNDAVFEIQCPLFFSLFNRYHHELIKTLFSDH